MHIHTYIHVYIYTCICLYIHTCTHAYIRTYIHTYMRTYMHTYIHNIRIHTFAYMHMLAYMCIYTCMPACLHVCIYVLCIYVCRYVCMYGNAYIYRYVFAIRHLGSYITLNICLYMTGCFIIFRRYLIHQLPFKWHYIKHQRRICVCACVHIPCFAKLVMRSFGFLESEHAKNIYVHTPGLPQLYFRFSFSDR